MVDIESRITELARGLVPDVEESITEDGLLSEILRDSLRAVEFLVVIEDEFEVDLDDAVSMEFFSSFRHIRECVERELLHRTARD